MTQYTLCCNSVCLLGNCKTREAGGCYCVCRLKDAESSCISLIEGKSYRKNGCIIYENGRIAIPLEGKEKEEVEEQLKNIREILKRYEKETKDEMEKR